MRTTTPRVGPFPAVICGKIDRRDFRILQTSEPRPAADLLTEIDRLVIRWWGSSRALSDFSEALGHHPSSVDPSRFLVFRVVASGSRARPVRLVAVVPRDAYAAFGFDPFAFEAAGGFEFGNGFFENPTEGLCSASQPTRPVAESAAPRLDARSAPLVRGALGRLLNAEDVRFRARTTNDVAAGLVAALVRCLSPEQRSRYTISSFAAAGEGRVHEDSPVLTVSYSSKAKSCFAEAAGSGSRNMTEVDAILRNRLGWESRKTATGGQIPSDSNRPQRTAPRSVQGAPVRREANMGTEVFGPDECRRIIREELSSRPSEAVRIDVLAEKVSRLSSNSGAEAIRGKLETIEAEIRMLKGAASASALSSSEEDRPAARSGGSTMNLALVVMAIVLVVTGIDAYLGKQHRDHHTSSIAQLREELAAVRKAEPSRKGENLPDSELRAEATLMQDHLEELQADVDAIKSPEGSWRQSLRELFAKAEENEDELERVDGELDKIVDSTNEVREMHSLAVIERRKTEARIQNAKRIADNLERLFEHDETIELQDKLARIEEAGFRVSSENSDATGGPTLRIVFPERDWNTASGKPWEFDTLHDDVDSVWHDIDENEKHLVVRKESADERCYHGKQFWIEYTGDVGSHRAKGRFLRLRVVLKQAEGAGASSAEDSGFRVVDYSFHDSSNPSEPDQPVAGSEGS